MNRTQIHIIMKKYITLIYDDYLNLSKANADNKNVKGTLDTVDADTDSQKKEEKKDSDSPVSTKGSKAPSSSGRDGGRKTTSPPPLQEQLGAGSPAAAAAPVSPPASPPAPARPPGAPGPWSAPVGTQGSSSRVSGLPPPGVPSKEKRKVSADHVEESTRKSTRLQQRAKGSSWQPVWNGEWVTK